MALDLGTLKANLAAAETAYHQLMMGERVVSTSNVDGGSVAYNQGSMSKLKAYISELEGLIARAESTQRRAPIYFVT